MPVTHDYATHRRRCRVRWVLGSLTGWSTLAHAPRLLTRARLQQRSGPMGDPCRARTPALVERVGVIHVHTDYSDGLAPFEEVATIAARCGLDFMLTADHRTLEPIRDGKQGYYGGCLALAGTQFSCREGYVLGFNLPAEFVASTPHAEPTLAEIRAAGGLGFVALTCDPRFAWRSLPTDGFVGMEIANLASLALRRLNPLSLVRAFCLYRRSAPAARLLPCTPGPELEAWDRLTLQRPVVGIGSVDAHALLRVLGRYVRFPSYEDSFVALRTHLLCRGAPTGDPGADAHPLYEALAAGRCFVSFHVYGDATGFRFEASSAAGHATMGGSLALGGGVRLRAQLPGEAVIRLMRNGRPVTTLRGSALDHAVQEAGVYRLEAYRPGGRLGPLSLWLRPWIFSNPVYVRA